MGERFFLIEIAAFDLLYERLKISWMEKAAFFKVPIGGESEMPSQLVSTFAQILIRSDKQKNGFSCRSHKCHFKFCWPTRREEAPHSLLKSTFYFNGM